VATPPCQLGQELPLQSRGCHSSLPASAAWGPQVGAQLGWSVVRRVLRCSVERAPQPGLVGLRQEGQGRTKAPDRTLVRFLTNALPAQGQLCTGKAKGHFLYSKRARGGLLIDKATPTLQR